MVVQCCQPVAATLGGSAIRRLSWWLVWTQIKHHLPSRCDHSGTYLIAHPLTPSPPCRRTPHRPQAGFKKWRKKSGACLSISGSGHTDRSSDARPNFSHNFRNYDLNRGRAEQAPTPPHLRLPPSLSPLSLPRGVKHVSLSLSFRVRLSRGVGRAALSALLYYVTGDFLEAARCPAQPRP